jgi:hypothetical protein
MSIPDLKYGSLIGLMLSLDCSRNWKLIVYATCNVLAIAKSEINFDIQKVNTANKYFCLAT